MKMFEQREHTGNKGDVFAYDEFRRLKGVKFNSPEPTVPETTQFDKSWKATYDKVDNILNIVKSESGQPDEVITPTIAQGSDNAKLNQYTTFDGWGLDYDKNGNTTQRGTQRFTYDYRNQIVKAEGTSGTPEVEFKYDALGRRVEKRTGSNTATNYYYSGFQVIEERDATDTLKKQFVYGSGIDEILRIDKYDGGTSTPYYVHTNGIGSVTAVTDENGDLVERVSYDVFGMPTFTDAAGQPLTSSSIGNDILFQGRRYDKETNLYYYRARYYDPIMGRFLQTDPMGYRDSMNMYQGFNMNPSNFVDPMGETTDFNSFPSREAVLAADKKNLGLKEFPYLWNLITREVKATAAQVKSWIKDPTLFVEYIAWWLEEYGKYVPGLGAGLKIGSAINGTTVTGYALSSEERIDRLLWGEIELLTLISAYCMELLPQPPRLNQPPKNLEFETEQTLDDFTESGGSSLKNTSGNLDDAASTARTYVYDQNAMNKSIEITAKQLQKKFPAHSADFGISGSYSPANAAKLENAIFNHIKEPTTMVINGTYRGNIPVVHFFNPETGLNVMKTLNGTFLSGWKLSMAQIKHLLTSGNIQ